MDSSVFDEDYFIRGKSSGKSLYENYTWLPDLTIPMACAMVRHLGIESDDTILDFGCARGYLVRAFRELGYHAWGYDISQWALENADPKIKEYLIRNESTLVKNTFDWVIAKDVLEHVDSEELDEVVDTLKIANKGVFVIVPLAHGKKYDIPEYELDVTHIHRHPLSWWVSRFLETGWIVEASYRVRGVKDNYWRPGFEEGNGFITCYQIKE